MILNWQINVFNLDYKTWRHLLSYLHHSRNVVFMAFFVCREFIWSQLAGNTQEEHIQENKHSPSYACQPNCLREENA